MIKVGEEFKNEEKDVNKNIEQEKVQDVIKVNDPKDKVPVKSTEMEALKDHNETNKKESKEAKDNEEITRRPRRLVTFK